MGDLSKNFSKWELHCTCCKELKITQNLIEILQELRDIVGKPFKINSGYRCPEHNKTVGGALMSQHVKGTAVDISTKGWSAAEKYALIQAAHRVYQVRGIGIYSSFIHLDVRKGEGKLWVGK